MGRKFSLAYLTIPGTNPLDQIRIAAEAGYDFVSLRPIGGGMFTSRPAEDQKRLLQGIRLGRIGTFEDVASAIAYLESDDASWTTGEVLDVNGGFSIDSLGGNL